MKLPANYNELPFLMRRKIREEYVRLQNGLCAHCGMPLDGEPREDIKAMKVTESRFPKDFFKWPVHLHHDHDTGMTKGAIHNKCNAVLWEYYGE